MTLLAALPPLHALLATPFARAQSAVLPPAVLREAARAALATTRAALRAGALAPERALLLSHATAQLSHALVALQKPVFRRVINATGVVLHTNLGRAPLAPEALARIVETSRGYATLEYDLCAGTRGHRDSSVQVLGHALFGADDTLVVNNGAAAVLLAVTCLAHDRDVVVSRGELVEIGGGFRIPDVIASCGARLVEVGTTNRTHARDYTRVVTRDTGAVLKVHRSNFTLAGFTHDVSVRDLVALARPLGVPIVSDLGSGLVDAIDTEILQAEPLACDHLAAGADVVVISGDKLLGGPQAGLLLGRGDIIARLRAHPLVRALRAGRLVYAALEATLRLHLEGRARTHVPALAMLATPRAAIEARAVRLAEMLARDGIAATVEHGDGRVGGGSLPEARVPSACVCVAAQGIDAIALEQALRNETDVPVIARVQHGRVVLDLLAVGDDEVSEVGRGVAQAVSRLHEKGANPAMIVEVRRFEPATDED